MHEDADFAGEAMTVGGDGYVVKPRIASDLMLAISEVLAARKFVSPTIIAPDARSGEQSPNP
jgi:DNA-binding NarL/FixJ family response regulator